MKISIITVTYNSANYLKECIESVVNQSYKNIEHIIVDGLSTDGTLDIIKSYDSHLAKWVSEKDKDMYDAINKGMKMATGDVIGILNSDDILASNDVIGEIVNTFKTQNLDAVYGDLVYVDKINTNRIIRYWKGLKYNRLNFTFGWMPAHPTFYLKRDLLDKYGDYNSTYFSAADYELMTRYLYKNKISARYIPKLLIKMRVGGQSNVSISNRIKANRRDYMAMKNNLIPYPFITSILKPLIKFPQYTFNLIYNH